MVNTFKKVVGVGISQRDAFVFSLIIMFALDGAAEFWGCTAESRDSG